MSVLLFEDKIYDEAGLAAATRQWHDNGGRIILTTGCFDLFHVGCVRFLQNAAAYGNRLVVGVLPDDLVARVKGPGRPVLPLEQRLVMVAAMQSVDAAFPLDTSRMPILVETIQPHCYYIREDYKEICPVYFPEHGSDCDVKITTGDHETCSDWLIQRVIENDENQ